MSSEIQKRQAVVVVGGFLGSGKTRLILAAVRLLEKHGLALPLF